MADRERRGAEEGGEDGGGPGRGKAARQARGFTGLLGTSGVGWGGALLAVRPGKRCRLQTACRPRVAPQAQASRGSGLYGPPGAGWGARPGGRFRPPSPAGP